MDMMLQVFKYSVPTTDEFTLELPKDGKILHFGEQADSLCIWVLVDAQASTESRTFRLAGTGHPIETEGRLDHIGCVTNHRGAFVWNLFETGRSRLAR